MLRKIDRYQNSAIALFCFVAAQAFQTIALDRWIPTPHSAQESLALYLSPINELRAVLVGAAILGLVLPYLVIALRYVAKDPIFSILGFLFALGFVGAETAHRSIDFFLVGECWAREFGGSSSIERSVLLEHFALWNDITRAWYFPLLLSHLISSFCFLRVTWTDWGRRGWFRLAPVAFFLNALRLLGRLLSMFAGQAWLNGLNNDLYFPVVFTVDALLIVWFLNLHKQSVPGFQANPPRSPEATE